MDPQGVAVSADPSGIGLERSIARLLTAGSYLSIALLTAGFGLMVANGIGPLSPGPTLDLAAIPRDLVALRPNGYLWLGLIVVVATPASRVIASLIGYLRRGERRMAIVATLILIVIALSVTLAQRLEG
ncbi:MAG TPA: DUF1634 domain-containing protein [Candidatus Limnocylindrales bacterium]|jgi:uncharacterized membrane protein|nr:DUF1634 domain-containing protein [Candidatus Limnocylindrales bacterium]